VIELTLTTAFYACVARVLRALQVDLEPGYEEQLRATWRGHE
jgi:hypothetical protein